MSLDNVQIRPHQVFLGKDQAQVQEITVQPGTSLGAKYFLLHSPSAKFYVWFNTGASVDPAPAGGWTEIEVAILVGDTAAIVAGKLQAVLDAHASFTSSVSDDVVTVTNVANGYAQPARDGGAVTDFAFEVTTLGSEEREVGCIAGNIEISGFEQSKVEVKCHDTGATVQKEIVSGYSNPELSITFQETDKESLKQHLIDVGMSSFTPIGADKEEVFGYGANKVGSSNPKIPVRLHPVEKDASDKGEDWNIWNAELSIDSMILSGEEVSTIPAKLKVYPDTTKPKSINFLMIGDAEKAGY